MFKGRNGGNGDKNPKRKKAETFESITKQALKEVKEEIRELREDVLINSWVNGTRFKMMEKTVEKLAMAFDKIVNFIDEVRKSKIKIQPLQRFF